MKDEDRDIDAEMDDLTRRIKALKAISKAERREKLAEIEKNRSYGSPKRRNR